MRNIVNNDGVPA